MFTVEQLRPDIAPFTLDSGRIPESEYVLKVINEARRLLWPRGNFVGLMESIRVMVYESTITLPYDYSHAINASVCSEAVQIDNEWYESADNVRMDVSCMGEIIDLGDRFATFTDYGDLTFRLMIKAEMREDQGKTMRFTAVGENDDRLEIVGNLGPDHYKVTFNPWIKYYRYAAKQQTVGRARVYIYDPNRGVEKICAIYEPDDLSPNYRRYRVPTRGPSSYYLRCKRRYRPLLRETDKVEFSTDALIQACIAITARRNKDVEKYTRALNLAVEHEQQQIKDDKTNTGGRIKLSRQRKLEGLIESHAPVSYRR